MLAAVNSRPNRDDGEDGEYDPEEVEKGWLSPPSSFPVEALLQVTEWRGLGLRDRLGEAHHLDIGGDSISIQVYPKASPGKSNGTSTGGGGVFISIPVETVAAASKVLVGARSLQVDVSLSECPALARLARTPPEENAATANCTVIIQLEGGSQMFSRFRQAIAALKSKVPDVAKEAKPSRGSKSTKGSLALEHAEVFKPSDEVEGAEGVEEDLDDDDEEESHTNHRKRPRAVCGLAGSVSNRSRITPRKDGRSDSDRGGEDQKIASSEKASSGRKAKRPHKAPLDTPIDTPVSAPAAAAKVNTSTASSAEKKQIKDHAKGEIPTPAAGSFRRIAQGAAVTAHDSSFQARESSEGSPRSFSDDADAMAARDDDDGDSWMAPRRHLHLAPASATVKRKARVETGSRNRDGSGKVRAATGDGGSTLRVGSTEWDISEDDGGDEGHCEKGSDGRHRLEKVTPRSNAKAKPRATKAGGAGSGPGSSVLSGSKNTPSPPASLSRRRGGARSRGSKIAGGGSSKASATVEEIGAASTKGGRHRRLWGVDEDQKKHASSFKEGEELGTCSRSVVVASAEARSDSGGGSGSSSGRGRISGGVGGSKGKGGGGGGGGGGDSLNVGAARGGRNRPSRREAASRALKALSPPPSQSSSSSSSSSLSDSDAESSTNSRQPPHGNAGGRKGSSHQTRVPAAAAGSREEDSAEQSSEQRKLRAHVQVGEAAGSVGSLSQQSCFSFGGDEDDGDNDNDAEYVEEDEGGAECDKDGSEVLDEPASPTSDCLDEELTERSTNGGGASSPRGRQGAVPAKTDGRARQQQQQQQQLGDEGYEKQEEGREQEGKSDRDGENGNSNSDNDYNLEEDDIEEAVEGGEDEDGGEEDSLILAQIYKQLVAASQARTKRIKKRKTDSAVEATRAECQEYVESVTQAVSEHWRRQAQDLLEQGRQAEEDVVAAREAVRVLTLQHEEQRQAARDRVEKLASTLKRLKSYFGPGPGASSSTKLENAWLGEGVELQQKLQKHRESAVVRFSATLSSNKKAKKGGRGGGGDSTSISSLLSHLTMHAEGSYAV
ncbi:unnamed protein product [Ectocarpus sp. 4 AP-2014]